MMSSQTDDSLRVGDLCWSYSRGQKRYAWDAVVMRTLILRAGQLRAIGCQHDYRHQSTTRVPGESGRRHS